MHNQKKIIVVMPAYNAAKTLQKTYDEVMEQGIVDLVILVDDASRDRDLGHRQPACPIHRFTSMRRTRATAETRRPATGWPWRRGRTSSSWSILITSTPPS